MTLPYQKHFQMIDQEIFAAASGDWNPMHMDPLAARRTQMGAPVVHGMHTVLTCLEAFAQSNMDLPGLTAIKVNFLKPVYVGDQVTFSISRSVPLRLSAETKGVKVMTIELIAGPNLKTETGESFPPQTTPIRQTPQEISFSDLEKVPGPAGKSYLSRSSAKLFPNIARWFGENRVGGLASLSALVGMTCPGLHSIFIGFTLELVPDSQDPHLEYSVLSTDERFRRIKLNVAGGGLKGVVDAAVRTTPVRQPSLSEISSRMNPNCFKGHRVLIVGGSRGIGEYTAKVIAAGGGQVTLTYHVGLAETRNLAAEIKAFGGEAELIAYDVLLPAAAQLEKLKLTPTHVYYFATGRIFGRHGHEFDPLLYQEFNQFYVTGFYELCSALRKKVDHFSVFYPSSIAVSPESRPKAMTEYAMAKAAGELLCADMRWLLPGVEVTVRRLPRLPTDQTATLLPVPGEEPMDILLPMILEMQGHG